MWNKTKEFFGWIAAAVVAIIAYLIYSLKRKEAEVIQLKTKEKLNEADKESAVMDTEIKHLEEEKENIQKDIDKADTEAVTLQDAKEQAIKKEKDRKTNEVTDYWNN